MARKKKRQSGSVKGFLLLAAIIAVALYCSQSKGCSMEDLQSKATGFIENVSNGSDKHMTGDNPDESLNIYSNKLEIPVSTTSRNEIKLTRTDYTNSGYDRGHMAPAADMKWSEKAMEESFYMSNICPQDRKLNRDDWGSLEETCRGWARKYGTVYIACGPIYDKKSPKRIGRNKVAVPDRFFKVVLIYNRKKPQAMGFLFENKAHHRKLENYMVTVDEIEQITGLDFFSRLPDDIENKIEAEIPVLPSTR